MEQIQDIEFNEDITPEILKIEKLNSNSKISLDSINKLDKKVPKRAYIILQIGGVILFSLALIGGVIAIALNATSRYWKLLIL